MQKQIQQIISLCSGGNQLSSFEIKTMIRLLAENFKKHITSEKPQSKIKQTQPKEIHNKQYIDEEIDIVKQILEKKITAIDNKIQKLVDKTREQLQTYIQSYKKDVDKRMQQANRNNIKQNDDIQIQTQFVLINEKIKNFEQKLSSMIKQKNSYHQKINDKIQALQDTSVRLIVEFEDSKKINYQNIIYSQKQIKKERVAPIKASEFVDTECKSYETLKISNNKISNGLTQYSAWIFGKQKINKMFQFVVQIDKMQNYIGLGIADTMYKKKDRLNGLPNWVGYYSDKDCYIGAQRFKNQGSGFRQGETLIVSANLNQGTVQWKVNKQLRHKIQTNILNDNSISYVPYIWLPFKDDSVKIYLIDKI